MLSASKKAAGTAAPSIHSAMPAPASPNPSSTVPAGSQSTNSSSASQATPASAAAKAPVKCGTTGAAAA